ncbi:ABC transporter substrate-binding protein [Thermocrinis sp.]|jgi:nitrate/nitrite transport system substrate-binding protein|uniref:ABC transporter substrate-binding protein n=1 Tax=Thermocrinis sp. TaxID=2024383 RepID=UPI003C108B06
MLTRREVAKGFAAGVGATHMGPYISKGAGKIRIGFIPLTDCASVVMARELGLYKKYGVDVEVTKEASWPNVRDKPLNGELTAAHCLFSLPLSVYTGVGGPKGRVIPIVMVLDFNGQGITLANKFKGKVGFRDIKNVKQAVQEIIAKEGECTFAMTFPGGTHDIWLRYWSVACGINPRYVVVPYTLPFMLTGLKISIGIAWMVIVAAEMLAGGTGIGFYLWDSWNALNLNNVISSILLIGVVGSILDYFFSYLQRRVQI